MRLRFVSPLVTLALLASACASGPPPVSPADVLGDEAVTVGSFNFDESVLLAELYAQALEARGFRVVRQLGLGPRELVVPALEKGLVELIPEYAGSLLEFVRGGPVPPSLTETQERLRAALAPRGLVPLASAFAQDQNGFAVTQAFARSLGGRAVSDLADEAGIVLGGPPECPQRPLCLQGLEDRYGVHVERFVPLDHSGPLTADALKRGLVDVALLFTTSAEILGNQFVLLADDLHLQPSEHVTPIVRADVLDRFGPELAAALDAVSSALTTQELRALNAEVVLGGRDPAEVARQWLGAEGLLPAG